jgi:hypothetical protein
MPAPISFSNERRHILNIQSISPISKSYKKLKLSGFVANERLLYTGNYLDPAYCVIRSLDKLSPNMVADLPTILETAYNQREKVLLPLVQVVG